MSDVPPEIITAILVRLPVKSLLRARCVSKPWRSMIDGQDFIKHHLRRSAETNSNRTLIVKSTKLFYVDLDSFEQLDTGNVRFKPQFVAGSCNGLVLLVSDSDDVVLWNPSTRKLNALPKSSAGNRSQGQYTLGYDSKHDDYKVVRLGPDCACAGSGCFCSDTKIYSLNSNSWKKIEDFPYKLSPGKTWGVYLNNALHTGFDREYFLDAMIMAFDIAEEEHKFISPPKFSSSRHLLLVEVLGGCLAAVISGKNNSSDIWVMKEYGVEGSWRKLLRFDPPIPKPSVNLCPLAYSKSGDEVLLNYEGIFLNWYNLKKKSVTIACVKGLSARFGCTARDPVFGACVCVGSLVSPCSPRTAGIEKPSGKKGNEIKKKKKRDDFLSVGFKLVL